MFSFIQCQCSDKRRGVYLLEKVSVFIKIRVLFWPEISALGVFLNFDNAGAPPSVPECPLPPGSQLDPTSATFHFADLSSPECLRNSLPHLVA